MKKDSKGNTVDSAVAPCYNNGGNIRPKNIVDGKDVSEIVKSRPDFIREILS